ncbi:CapA family protein [Paenisporosarcina quisquiliarum]|uniref:CapA family protein n=1 Tax=Paenisporosarcina quisquiliarum TaxID=365346 RepID=UPI00373627F1
MKKYIILFALFVFLGGCEESSSIDFNVEVEPVTHAMEIEPIQPKKLDKPIVKRAKLVAIGDILLHQPVYKDAATPEGTYDFSPMFTQVKPLLESADIAVANQETMIGGKELGLSSYPLFNSPFEIGDALKDAGIDIVTLANNHTMDKGEQAIQNALSYWNQIQMPYTGAFQSFEDREEIRTLTKNDITFSFLAYSYGTNGMPVPEDKPYLINLIDLPLIQQDVRKAKESSDVVVVSMHWGNEYESLPSTSQLELARELSTMGVDIIIGHHPHVLQPMDWIERPDGSKTFIMYSLGNFLSGQIGLDRRIGGIGGIEVTKTIFQGKSTITLNEPNFISTYTHHTNNRDFEIIPMDVLTDAHLIDHKQYSESTQHHMATFIDELLIVE